MDIAEYLIVFVAVFNFDGLIADTLVPATAKQQLQTPYWLAHVETSVDATQQVVRGQHGFYGAAEHLSPPVVKGKSIMAALLQTGVNRRSNPACPAFFNRPGRL